jgi:hypothetical protein
MATAKVPASERVATAFRELATSSKNLNDALGEWNASISALNVALKKLDIQVSAWHQIASGDDELQNFWRREIGYSKVGDHWCIALKRTWGDYTNPDDEGSEIWRFEDAPRWMMLEASGKIAELLETLVKRTVETTEKVRKRREETAEVVSILDSIASEVSWLAAAEEASK